MSTEDEGKDKSSLEARKKENIKDKVYNNRVEINPKLNEAKGKTVVLGWGRMNPVTIGHEKLANKIKDVAKKNNATPLLYLTHSQDSKKNPLSYNDKVMLAKKAFGDMVQKSNAKTIMQAMVEIESKFSDVILVVGQDRVKEFETLLNKYNGKDYTFDSIKVVSAGDRDPDAEGVEGMSASKMRAAVAEGDKESFISGLPSKLKSMGDKVYDMVRSGMKISEELEEALTRQQRRQRGIIMRRNRVKIARARERAKRRPASIDKLKKRARRAAIQAIRKRIVQKRGENYANLSSGEKEIIDKKVAKRKGMLDRISKRLLPAVRKKEIERRRAMASKKVNEEFERLFEVRQDSDIKDKEGTQPAKYHAGLSKSTKDKRDAHFKKGAEMDDNNPAAYKPAPGDAEAKTKESKYTKKYKEMYGEAYENPPTKRFHEVRKKDGSIKLDRRFRAFKNRAKPLTEFEKEEMTRSEKFEYKDDVELINMIEQVSKEILESVELEESKTETALKTKSEKSGIAYGILKDVYDRGVAAWRTGHRPGTTPAQWGMARVNSFITGGKTRTTADADLWKKHKGVKEEVEIFTLDEQFEFLFLDEESILDKALAAIDRQITKGMDLMDVSYNVSRARGVDFSAQELKRKYIEKFGDPKKKSSSSEIGDRISAAKRKYGLSSEEHGAGDRGTPEVTKRYKKDTPGEVAEQAPDTQDAMKRYKAGKAGFTDIAHLKAKGLIPRADGEKRKSPKYEEFELQEQECQLVGVKQIKEFEKVVDQLFQKFGIDFKFTKHFADRMGDERNDPCITLKELADFIKKIYARQGKSLKGVAGAEAVVKDMQKDLNIPVAVTYDQKNDEFDVVMKTIMRKKNFRTPNKIITY